MGFKSLVRDAEAQKGLSLENLSKAVEALGTEVAVQRIKTYGPMICPMAPRVQKNLDFRSRRPRIVSSFRRKCRPPA
jgi:hypothetical protein